MSVPPVTPPADVGSTFATQDSPWMRYLTAIKDGWIEAQALYDYSDTYMHRLKYESKNDTHYNASSAKITDIDRDNNVLDWRTIAADDLSDQNLIEGAVNNFIHGLHTSATDVHTRLITLQWPNFDDPGERWDISRTRCLFFLLFCHVLGIELELTPAEILHMLGPSYGYMFAGGVSNLPLGSRTVQLSFNATVPASIACSFLGNRDIQGSQVDHVVICLTSPWLVCPKYQRLLQGAREVRSTSKQAYNHAQCAVEVLRMPPTAADILQMKAQPKPLPIEDPGACFAYLLENGDWKSAITKPGEKQWHWLSSLIRMLHVQHKFMRMDMKELRTPDFNSAEKTDYFGTATDEIKECIEETSARLDSLCADHDLEGHDDVKSDLRSLKEVKATLAAADCVKSNAQRIATQKTMEMSKLSISESRNAIALTVLALFFVPVSLASSIFGMNVQEINETGPKIWTFAVTALVMLTLSGISFTTWRMVRNMMLLYRHTATQSNVADFVFRRNRGKLMLEQLDGRAPNALEKMMYLFGLRRIEKTGIGAV